MRAANGPAGCKSRRGRDERVIELPWVAGAPAGGRALEVGYCVRRGSVTSLALLHAGFDELTGVDLAEADVPGMTTVRADVRELPSRRAHSTSRSASRRSNMSARITAATARSRRGRGLRASTALRELRRVARSERPTVDHGAVRRARRLRLVPAGRRTRLDATLHASGFFVEEQEVYELTDEGWRSSPELVPAGLRYGERGPAHPRSSVPSCHRGACGGCSRQTESSVRHGAVLHDRCAACVASPNRGRPL